MQKCRNWMFDRACETEADNALPPMLIYTEEGDLGKMTPEVAQRIRDGHAALSCVRRAKRSTALLVAVNGEPAIPRPFAWTPARKVLATDGAFAETRATRRLLRARLRGPERGDLLGRTNSEFVRAKPKARSRFGNSSNLKACPSPVLGHRVAMALRRQASSSTVLH